MECYLAASACFSPNFIFLRLTGRLDPTRIHVDQNINSLATRQDQLDDVTAAEEGISNRANMADVKDAGEKPEKLEGNMAFRCGTNDQMLIMLQRKSSHRTW